jgi:hypothetical protein
MSAHNPTSIEKAAIISASNDIFDRLRKLRYPPHAAYALAFAHTLLIENSGAKTEADVRRMLKESDEAVLGNWSAHTGIPLAS